ncbi:4'-phosphopantetheinyl transferase [Streptomyces sp. NPDC088725]|uniref:4'-phosphopantetheinyl transferase family protein n=1 Tax=Streptomyces sp. NPDC088725 TaxID=3365873 RepID=UPI0037FD99EB
MIEELLPAPFACADSFEDFGEDTLFAEERALLGQSVDKRRREFATVRACARQALSALGLPPSPVLPGVRNAPAWPAGIVGSMTHCDGYRAAALARSSGVLAVGIDAEPDLPLPAGLAESIALPAEQAWLRRESAGAPGGGVRGAAAGAGRPGGRAICWDRLLFSAKEAVYKTWYPMMRTELDFDDAEITFATDTPGRGTFEARILRPARGPHGRVVDRFSGGWLAERGLLVTAIAFSAPAPAGTGTSGESLASPATP